MRDTTQENSLSAEKAALIDFLKPLQPANQRRP